MPDDMLRDAIETSRRILDIYDFETQGTCRFHLLRACGFKFYFVC
jgi:hypothetical protein